MGDERAPWRTELIAGIVGVAVVAVCLVLAGRADAVDPVAQLDPSFGVGGAVAIGSGTQAFGTAVTIDHRGRIVAAGMIGSSDVEPVAVRLDQNGTKDVTFGTGGMSSVFSWADAITTDSLDRVIAAGDEWLQRLLPDGTPDPLFGTDGIWQPQTILHENWGIDDIAVDAAARIHLDRLSTVSRRKANGDPDISYGVQGGADPTGTGVTGLVVWPDGSVTASITGCCSDPTSPQDMAVERITADGLADLGFGTNGVVRIALPGDQIALDVVALADGSVLVVGQSREVPSFFARLGTELFVAHVLADGRLDPAWGTSGVIRVALSSPSLITAAAISPDGPLSILLARSADGMTFDSAIVAITRVGSVLLGESTLPDSTLSGLGPFGAYRDIAVAGTRRIIAVGNTGTPSRTFVVSAFALPSPPPVTPPSPTPPSSGGSSTSGSGGANLPDLQLKLTADRARVASGEQVALRASVNIVNYEQTSGAGDIFLTVALSPGLELISTAQNRGGGCKGTTTIVCDLNFLAHVLVANVDLVLRSTTSSEVAVEASVKAFETDPVPANNAARVVLNAVAPLTPPVVVRAPASPAATRGVRRIGTARSEEIRGTRFADTLDGRAGDDRILGLEGADVLTGGAGRDVISAGLGDDIIRVRDGIVDTVSCGPGTDTVVADTLDRLTGCEKVARS